jgi:hypothetical protein
MAAYVFREVEKRSLRASIVVGSILPHSATDLVVGLQLYAVRMKLASRGSILVF